MNLTADNLISISLAVGLHAAVVLLLWMGNNSVEMPNTIEVQQFYIEAALVAENPHKARAKRDQEQVRKKQADRRNEEKRRQAAAKTAEENALKKAQADRQSKADQASRLEALQVAEQQEQAAAEEKAESLERLAREQQLALQMAREEEYRRAVTDDERAMAYVTQIQREIIQNWSRPPSARNGMQVLLKVNLVPTGEVVDVKLIKSSGNDAFDRSAMVAVRKAERFVVPAATREFERNFREFEVLFKPDDLRL